MFIHHAGRSPLTCVRACARAHARARARPSLRHTTSQRQKAARAMTTSGITCAHMRTTAVLMPWLPLLCDDDDDDGRRHAGGEMSVVATATNRRARAQKEFSFEQVCSWWSGARRIPPSVPIELFTCCHVMSFVLLTTTTTTTTTQKRTKNTSTCQHFNYLVHTTHCIHISFEKKNTKCFTRTFLDSGMFVTAPAWRDVSHVPPAWA